MNQRGFAPPLLFLVVVLVLVGLGSYFFFSNRTSPKMQVPKVVTEVQKLGLQDYSNQELDFTFQYSNTLIVKQDSEEEFNKRGNGDFRKNFKGYVEYEPGKFLGAVVVLDKSNGYDTNPLTIWIFDNPQDLKIDAWYKDYWYYPFVWGDFTYKGKVELAPKDEATISGQLSKSGIIDYQPGKPKFVYISKDKKMYLFRVIGEDGEKILQSFKFN